MKDRVYEEKMGQPPVNFDGMPGTEKKRPKNMAGSKKPAKKMAMGGKVYAKGGYVRAADGVAIKGKTRGKFC
jgi:hypothetical protein